MTVLDTLNRQDTPLSRAQLAFPGAYGISCVEAGEPQAGVESREYQVELWRGGGRRPP